MCGTSLDAVVPPWFMKLDNRIYGSKIKITVALAKGERFLRKSCVNYHHLLFLNYGVLAPCFDHIELYAELAHEIRLRLSCSMPCS